MRNLKKILALVLALVMSMSLVTVASAAYEDQDQIDARYAEAVQVLSDMGIFKGYNGGASFGPKALITREEVAAMMYRVMSTDLKDEDKGLYVEAAKFSDVPSTKWSAGYIGYCFNGNYVKGYEDGTFGPAKNVTGYEVLAMILRAVGYDKNGEFSGTNWKKEIATTAQDLGILSNVAPTVVLSQPATRELVAELIFRTMVDAQKVTYTPAFGYQSGNWNFDDDADTIGWDNFGLYRTGRLILDQWGRPGYKWVWATGASVFPETAAAKYTVAACECELADDIYLSTIYSERTVRLFDNAVERLELIGEEHTAYDATYGGQGTQIEVYPRAYGTAEPAYVLGTEYTVDGKDYVETLSYTDDIIVIIDTYLAEVTDVIEKEVDDRNHVVVSAANALDVHFGTDCDNAGATEGFIAGNKYAKGDFILVNYNAAKGTYTDLGVAKTINGTQTVNWYFEDKHTIEKKDYNDAAHFSLDEAVYDDTKPYTWFLDQFGNVIGDVEIINPKTYGIVTSAQWRNPDDEHGYARATIMYMDGTTATNKILSDINGEPFFYCDANELLAVNNNGTYTFEDGAVCTNLTYNLGTSDHLYEITVNANGTLSLTSVDEMADAWVYDGDPVVDQKTAANASVTDSIYVDNATMFLIRSVKNGAYVYTPVTGYDNLEDDYELCVVDYIVNADDEFCQFVYLCGQPKAATDTSSAKNFVMITSKTYAKELYNNGVKVIALYGVVRGDGSTAPVLVAADAAGLPNYTGKDNELTQWIDENENKLFLVTTKTAANLVKDWADIEEVGADDTIGNKTAGYGQFAGLAREYQSKGVLVTEGGMEYYNVNNSTTIINKNGKGTLADLKKAIADGAYVYVVGSYQTAKAVFITTVDVALEMGFIAALVEAPAQTTEELDERVSDTSALKDAVALCTVGMEQEVVEDTIYVSGTVKALDDANLTADEVAGLQAYWGVSTLADAKTTAGSGVDANSDKIGFICVSVNGFNHFICLEEVGGTVQICSTDSQTLTKTKNGYTYTIDISGVTFG